ncbi:methyltransferase [Asanoa iriomotensis]|uniref:O-methyltransferase n=1 Tax=Asanoa iriomotensis TaxID=234613 RepID=A0ABQ4C0U5_9ACTN|nr:methyltransferase [Asanoa iriomotensis]GIF56406.1 O-methyltransferase [Asanoa iriomotensis]
MAVRAADTEARTSGDPAGNGAAPGDHPGRFLQLGTAFCGAKILLGALELGLFPLLRKAALTEPEIREQLGLHPRGTRDWLNALVGFGVLEYDGQRYHNAAGTSRYLIKGQPGYVGGFLERADRMLYPAWGRFTDALRTGEPQSTDEEGEPYDTMITDADQLREFLGMMDAMNGQLGPQLAETFDWSAYGSVVDVGGARGNLIAPVAKAFPHLDAGVFDLPHVEPFFHEHMATLGLDGRVHFTAGSFFTDPLPRADVIVIGHVLHDWSPEQREALVAKAYEAVNEGGVLLVYDPMLDEEQPNLINLVISLDMLLTTRGGAEYAPGEARSWFEKAGFTVVDQRPLGFSDTLIVGRKDG